MDNIFEQLKYSFLEKKLSAIRFIAAKLLHDLHSNVYNTNNFYFHPLGFIYAVLHTFDNKETIRVHIWNKKFYNIIPYMEIHNHYYVVNSFIFSGCVNNNIFKITTNENDSFSIFTGSYSANGDRILTKTENKINLSLERTETHCAGNLYQIQLNEIHSGICINNDQACTIVYTETPRSPTPLVVGPVNSDYEYRFSRELVDAKVIDAILQELLSA